MTVKKSIAIFTAFCFLTVFAGQSFAQITTPSVSINVIENNLAPRIIPGKIGNITEFKNYNSEQVIVNIQDLHSHPQTQKNIAAILKTLDEKYTIKNIYAEGASGKVDISWLKFADKNIVKQMLDDGKLTGAEYFAYSYDKDNLFGLENPEIHRKNIVRLGAIYENEESNLQTAEKIKSEINYLVNKNLNSEMKNFIKNYSLYHSDKIEASKYYKTLLKYADKINDNPQQYSNTFNINSENFTEIQKVVLIDEISKKLNVKRINSLLQKYLSGLKNKISVWEFRELSEKTDNMSDMDLLLEYIVEHNMVDNLEGELSDFFKIVKLNAQINPVKLFAQEQKMEEFIRRALTSSELEKETAFLNDFYLYFENYLTNKLTAVDEEYFNAHFETFKNIYSKYASTDYLRIIDERSAFFNEYYKTNDIRNEIFVESVNKNDNLISGKEFSFNTPQNILADAKEIIVVIAGGYHTFGLNNIFDEQKISRITITPKISEGTQLSDAIFKKIINEQSKIFSQSMSFVIASQTSDEQKFKTIVEAGLSYLGKDISFENIDILKDRINLLIDGENIVEIDSLDENNAELKFSNGAVIPLSKTSDGAIIIGKDVVPAKLDSAEEQKIKISDAKTASAYFNLAKSLSTEALESLYDIAVLDLRKDSVYAIAKDFFIETAASAKDFGVNGIIPDIDAYLEALAYENDNTLEALKDTFLIDGISYNLLSRMPEFFQQEAFVRHLNADKNKSDGDKKQNSFKRALKKITTLFMIAMTIAVLSACGQNADIQQQSQPGIVDEITQAGDEAEMGYVDVSQIRYSSIEDEKIVVTDENGNRIDYTIKGICYSRDERGRKFGEHYKDDLLLLKELGVNNIRTYRPFAVYGITGKIDVKATRKMLDAFWEAGISVTVGFSYEDMEEGSLMDTYIETFGDHPAILMIVCGNEYNYHYEEWFSKTDWLNRLSQSIARVKQNWKDNHNGEEINRIFAVVHGEVPSTEEVAEYKQAGVDLIMMNIYRGPSFGDLSTQWQNLNTGMPLVISETGRSSANSDMSDSSLTQIEFMNSLTKEIIDMNGNVMFFEFCDESWKPFMAFNDTIGLETKMGLYEENRKPKQSAEILSNANEKINDGYDGKYIDKIETTDDASASSSELELPFFAKLVDKLGIKADKYPKTRAAIIATLEAPIMMSVGSKTFAKLHKTDFGESFETRYKATKKIKSDASSIGLFGLTATSAVSSIIALMSGFSGLLPLIVFSAGLAVSLISVFASFVYNHYKWNLYGSKQSSDGSVRVNMIYAGNEKNMALLGKKYGMSASVNSDGTVSQNIFILNEKPSQYSKLSNSGIKVAGKTVWISKPNSSSIIYYAQGVSLEEISAAVQNKNLEKAVKGFLNEQKVFLTGKVSIDCVEVDSFAKKTGTEYDKRTGNIKIYLGDDIRQTPYTAADFDRMRDIRNAQGWQRAQSLRIFLDKTETLSEFQKYLNIAANMSNGNIIIKETLAKTLASSGKLESVLERLRKDGINIMIDISSTTELDENILNLFDGKFYSQSENKTVETNIAGEGKNHKNAFVITRAQEMEKYFGQMNNDIVIYESAIEEYVLSDRSGLGKFISEIMSFKILKYFSSAEITAETAKETAKNFDISGIMRDFADIGEEDIREMYYALQKGKTAEEIFLLNDRLNIKSAARMYLEKIDSEVENKTIAQEIKTAYMEGLLEKLAAVVEFKKSGRTKGFKNRNTEKLVGRLALFKYLPFKSADISADKIKERIGNVTAENYNNEMISVINEHPQSIPLVADLMLEIIFAYEEEIKLDKKDFKQEIDLRAVNAVLSAA